LKLNAVNSKEASVDSQKKKNEEASVGTDAERDDEHLQSARRKIDLSTVKNIILRELTGHGGI